MGSTMLGAHGLAHQGICSFVHLVVRLKMLFTKKLFRTCHYIPAQNKHVNHLYIAILHISVLCLTVFLKIIPTPHCTRMPGAVRWYAAFSIGMITMGVTSHAEKSRFCLNTCERATTSGVSLLNHFSISKACVRHASAWCPPAVVVQVMKWIIIWGGIWGSAVADPPSLKRRCSEAPKRRSPPKAGFYASIYIY